MKIRNVGLDNGYAIVRGWVGPNAASSSGLTVVTDNTTSVGGVTGIVVDGGTVTDLGNGFVLITITAGGALEVGDGTTTVSDIASLLVPLGGVIAGSDAELQFVTSVYGGQEKTQVITASGASQTLDLSLYNAFDITLTASCTLTFSNPPPSGVLSGWVLILRQGGSGSYTVTYPGSVKWRSSTGTNTGSAPTLYTAVGAQDDILVSTVDGGTTYGGQINPHESGITGFATPAIVLGTAAAAGSAATAIRSDATIVAFDTTAPANVANVGVASSTGSVAVAARRDHGHALTYHDEILTDGASNFIFDGGDAITVTGVPN